MKADKLLNGLWLTGDILGIIIGAIIILGLTIDFSNFWFYTSLVTVTEGKAPQKIAQTLKGLDVVTPIKIMNIEPPLYIRIPIIKISAILEHIGLTREGAIGVPIGHNNAAWYKEGTRPGDVGSAIISGHYGIWKDGKPAIFNNLSKLRRGDKIYIEDESGSKLTFIVRESKKYTPTDQALDVFNINDGESHLNIITCEGVWSTISKTYSSRLVVFADKEIK